MARKLPADVVGPERQMPLMWVPGYKIEMTGPYVWGGIKDKLLIFCELKPILTVLYVFIGCVKSFAA